MNIAITGGSGLIGHALATELAAEGHQVTILSRDPSRVRQLPAGVRAEAWDACTTEPLLPMIGSSDVVVHLAGESIGAGRWTRQQKRRILESRVSSGAAIADAIAQVESRPSVLIQASGIGYYGPQGENVVTEGTPAGSDWVAHVARLWERSTKSVTEVGVRRVVIRSGVVLDKHRGALPRMVTPFRLGVGGPVGGGRQYLAWIHLADEVAAIRFLMDHEEAAGAYNLTSPNPATNADLGRALGRVLHRPAVLPIPAVMLRLLYGEMATVVLDGQRAVPQRLAELGFTFRYPDLELALRAVLA
jgi:uncharacterized protein